MLREVICWGLFSSTLTRLIPHNLNTSLEMYLIRTSHVLIDLPEQVTVWCSGGCEEDVALMEDRCPAVLDHQLWDLQLQSRFRGSGLYLMSDWSSSLVLLFILLVYEDLRDELFIQICSGWFLSFFFSLERKENISCRIICHFVIQLTVWQLQLYF